MPRPGPRPYECVRRAWHSDRHIPMRGSIIQQIFRVVNEAHSSATKKNREWQEKLPVVVFKAEQIMYSKANSEAEYMSPDTIWDRVNDAVNTIIRRDESTESGEFLPPCVEAALNLGCVPVRASRSQRHSNPRSYLSPRAPEPVSTPPRVFNKTADEGCPQSSPLQTSDQLNFPRPVTTMNSTRPVTESGSRVVGNNNIAAPSSYPFRYDNIPPVRSQMMTVDTNTPMNSGSVYPLYYGTHRRAEESHAAPTIPENAEPNTIFFGTPICTSVMESAEMGIRNVLSGTGTGTESAISRTAHADKRDTCETLPGMECDLSLRLGLFTGSYSGAGKSLVCETEQVSRTYREGGELRDLSRQRNMEFCFFPRKPVDGSFESCPSRLFPEDECLNLDASVRKRKLPFSDNEEDGEFCWHPELPSTHFMNRVKWSGL